MIYNDVTITKTKHKNSYDGNHWYHVVWSYKGISIEDSISKIDGKWFCSLHHKTEETNHMTILKGVADTFVENNRFHKEL